MLSLISKSRSLTKLNEASKTLIAFSSQVAAAPSVKPAKGKDSIRKQILDYRYAYPEFLPDPKLEYRNLIREKLERTDMVARRTQIDIPEFYVGKK